MDSIHRLLHGGSFHSVRGSGRCAYHYLYAPDFRYFDVGFRVVTNRVKRELAHRAVRGGFFAAIRVARSALRCGNVLHDSGFDIGFRVVTSKAKGESTRRMLRGGTFYYDKEDARCALCNCYNPYHRYYDSGFRVVVQERIEENND